ncbi:GH92 family glycosyl hydrolase [Cellulomonas edaphi]|uniref:GH92 family glycosyl hydrolase n=1 Tax=Cellulomonas edaphi TaxID=3053468 RepID=A0ABT7S4X0_9CELL|nr:GH92 family glycosyl hydrolase [Cellulomons edaphi]MDM7830668.1 GH92 family glycosyl hydrolase [Cellulomons edaphi]
MARTLRPRAPETPRPRRRTATLTALVAAAATTAAGLIVAPSAQAAEPVAYVSDPAQYVNPFIGTQDEGNTYPGATVPFGMVQLSPDTGHNTGYDYTQGTVRGFSTTHMSGVGCGLDGFVPILPTTSTPSSTDYASSGYNRSFKKVDGAKVESAAPGYYTATLTSGTDVDIRAELTATEHTGLQRYTYPETTTANVLINAGQSLSSVSASSVTVVGDDTVLTTSTVSGFCQATAPFTVYSVTKFSRPFASAKTWVDNTYSASTEASSSKRTGALLQFDTSGANSRDVTFQTAISYVDEAGAKANLAAEATTFDAAKAAASSTWNSQLAKIKVPATSSDPDPLSPYATQLRTFYSSLYRTFLAPNTGTDVDGRYRGWDAGIHDVDAEPGLGKYYQNYSLWDTYRTQQQVLALLEPQRSKDMALSVVLQSEQGGWAPRWGYGPVETNIMTGDPVTPFLVSAWHQGLLTRPQAERAYAVLRQNADEVPPASSVFNGRMGNPTYIKDGYVAFNPGAAHKPGDFDLAHGGSATLEYALADATLSTLAADLGHEKDAERYAQRGQNFRAVWDAEHRTFRSRGADGLFVAETDPSQIDGFHEGTSLQYEWLAQQDIPALIDLFGGTDATNERLDDFFVYGPELLATPNAVAKPATNSEGGWVTGAYSYYGTTTYNPNNEPDLHSPFVYLWTGQPWKTTDVVRAALTLFTDGPQGVTGNDDLGQMSSWAVASSLGIFPIMPGSDVWGLSTPVFTSIDITLDESFYPGSNGHLVINAPGRTDADRYVQSLRVGGETIDRAHLTGPELVNAGTIDYTVGSAPSSWATAPAAAPGTIATAEAPTRVYVPNGTAQVAAEPGETLTGKIAAIVQGPQALSGTVTVVGTDQISAVGSGEWTADTRGGSVQLPIPLKVADDAPPGVYPITVRIETTEGVAASGTAVISVGQRSWLAATGAFDNKAIGQPVAGSANFANGEFLIRSGMAGAGLAPGVVLTAPTDSSLTYVLHDLGPESTPQQYDNLLAQGQTTDVTEGMAGATKIAFIGSVNNGPVAPAPLTLTYTDGSTQTIADFGFTDWCSGSPQTEGNVLVGKTPQRWAGGIQNLACGLWATKSYSLSPGKDLQSITWPNTPKVHVFAIARDTAATVAPAIRGTVAVGSTLEAVPGTYPTAGFVESYQWRADGEPIDGATKDSLPLTAELAGSTISLTVSARHPALSNVIVTTTPETDPVALGTYTVLTEPTLSGTAQVDATLSVSAGTYSTPDVVESYVWRADGAVIAGATGATLKLGAEQLGTRVSVTVSSAKAGYAPAEPVTTAPTVPVVASSITVTRAPAISGTAVVGQKLTASAGSYSVPGVKVAFQWLRNGAGVKGAASATYTLTAADKGARMSVRVAASKPGYTTVVTTSTTTAPVKAGTITIGRNVAVTGAAKVGSTLKVTPGTYSPSSVAVAYRWLRNGVAITGATSTRYTVTAADKGKAISVRATVSKAGYATVVTTSRATSKVVAGTITVTSKARVAGTAKVGSTLKVVRGSSSPSSAKATYRWLRDGVAIKGATSTAYTLRSADRGAKIAVKVTLTRSGYATKAYTTASSSRVR